MTTVVGRFEQYGFAPGPPPGLIGYPVSVALSGGSLYLTTADGLAVVRNLP